MPVFTLTTDFGLRDYYVGSLKGSLIRKCPEAKIFDITHEVQAFNINEAAFALHNAYLEFPERTIHIVSVESFESGPSRYIALERNNHFFIGPDNGLFSLTFQNPPHQAVELISGKEVAASTFPIKDYLLDVACSISDQQDVSQLGVKVTDLMKRTSLQPVLQQSRIRGTVIHIDAFENAILNINKDLFNHIGEGREFSISFRWRESIDYIVSNYWEVPEGEMFCLFNASGYLQISIKKGKASSLLGLSVGDTVQIEFS